MVSTSTSHAAVFSETRRQIVHMAMGGFALLLRVLTWWQAAGLAAVAVVFNIFLLPRLGGHRLYRPSETVRGVPTGIIIYPLSVLLLILIFPRRPDVVAAAWGILAFGDASATLAGRALGGPRIPWNRDKTLAGTAAFIVTGAMAGVFLAWWTSIAVHPRPSTTFLLVAPIVAALVAGAAESMPVRLDDNILVPATAASVLWSLSLASRDASAASWPGVIRALGPALAVNGVMALAAWKTRAVNTSGALSGAIIGIAVYIGAGLGGWLLLFAAFAAATVSSRFGLKRKRLLGIAEEREGRRGAGNALANCGLAAVAALLALITPHRELALLAAVAALTAGGSDTVASEIGKARGRHTFLITSLKRVPPGTSGAVSVEGTAAGLVAAFGLAALALAGQLISPGLVVAVVVAATTGAVVESILGATLEGRGILNNDLLNFINTAVAAVCAVALAYTLR